MATGSSGPARRVAELRDGRSWPSWSAATPTISGGRRRSGPAGPTRRPEPSSTTRPAGGAWRREARWWRRAAPRWTSTSTTGGWSGPTSPPSSTPRRRPASGTRPPPSTGPRPVTTRPTSRPRSVQLMTYLVENEQAALVVPARFLGRIHPHFREVVQLLAVQVADEARHVEVFTRRALLARRPAGRVGGRWPGVAGHPGGRARLRPRLVPAVGAGGGELPQPAGLPRAPRPRPRHPAGVAPRPRRRGPPRGLRAGPPRTPGRGRPGRCGTGCGRRWSAATTPWPTPPGSTTRSSTPSSCWPPGRGTPRRSPPATARVQRLQEEMDEGRQRRLVRLGFPPAEAAALSALHTRNFM